MENTGLMNLHNLAWVLSENKFQSSDLISGCVAFFDDKMTNWHDLLWGKYAFHLIEVLFLIWYQSTEFTYKKNRVSECISWLRFPEFSCKKPWFLGKNFHSVYEDCYTTQWVRIVRRRACIWCGRRYMRCSLRCMHDG